MYVCMYTCIYVCVPGNIYERIDDTQKYQKLPVCIAVCMYICIDACIYLSALPELFALLSEYVLFALFVSVLTIVGARILGPPGVSLVGALW